MPLVSRTRATLRSAEFGFFGVPVNTRVQTPRFCGAPRSAGVFAFDDLGVRPLRTIWLMVGTSAFHEHAQFPRDCGPRDGSTVSAPRHAGSGYVRGASDV